MLKQARLMLAILALGGLIAACSRASETGEPIQPTPAAAATRVRSTVPTETAAPSIPSKTVALPALTATAAPSSPSATAAPAPLGIDLSTLLAVDYRRSGGLAGVDEHVQLFRDGHVVLTRSGQEPATFWLTPDEIAQIDAAFEAVDFYRAAVQEPTPPPPAADAFQYQLTRRGLLLQASLNTHDGAVPTWAQPLLDILTGLLLVPRPDRDQPPAADQVAAGDAEQRVVILELRRVPGEGGPAQQILLNVDRSFSIARNGVVTVGRLTEQQMKDLLASLEGAGLAERQGDYLPADTCCDRTAYELVYRNLFGSYRVRTMDGAVPDWLQPLLDTTAAALVVPEQVAEAPDTSVSTPSPAIATPAPAASPATATPPAATPTAPAAPAPSPTATVTITATTPPAPPTATPSEDLPLAYAVADLLADLAATGATIEATTSPIRKPYLGASGTIVRVDGQPVQVFEYADQAALDADLARLAADASSVGDSTLVWPAAPHFWRRGSVLALAVTGDPALLQLLETALGPQVAGR